MTYAYHYRKVFVTLSLNNCLPSICLHSILNSIELPKLISDLPQLKLSTNFQSQRRAA